jgi:hypothetical protein
MISSFGFYTHGVYSLVMMDDRKYKSPLPENDFRVIAVVCSVLRQFTAANRSGPRSPGNGEHVSMNDQLSAQRRVWLAVYRRP